ncbi:MAG TPA: serine/threonine-protein kinase [Gemmataceae bacterium]|nr:serine/threonine-protein kinase [Gemmataceae bacterium]
MEKRPVPKPAPGKQAPPRSAEADTAMDSTDPEAGGKPLAQTEEFTMPAPNEDDAANFLLDKGEAKAPPPPLKKPRPKELDDTVPYNPASAPPRPVMDETIAQDEDEAPPAKKPAPKAAPKSAAQPAPAPAKTKEIVMGDYRLTKKLGQGGMGAVYLGHQVSLDRPVALKVLSKELASKPAFVERFKREARVMAKLDHPNILRCYDVGEASGHHYLTMEFVEGGSVQDWLKKLGKFSLGDALHLTLACAHALQHAHELNLIHRDIKPDNILLTKKGVVKVADLGLAKATDDDLGLTKTGTGAGTPIYMAPEQARDSKHVDGRTDIYAMGVMLYVFLTGEIPFKGETLVEMIESKEKGKFSPPRKFNAEVPERLNLIVDKMLVPKPEHRYQSCAEVILDLDSLGMASDRLSFIEPPPGPSKNLPPAPPPKKINVIRSALSIPRSTSTTSSAPAEPPADEYWYASFTAADGKAVTRKLTFAQLQALVRSGSLDAETQVSKTLKGGYRALGTYPEFQGIIKANRTKEKADKKAEKFKAIYEKIDKQEKSRLRWRWFHNMTLRAGGFLGFILWLIILVAIGVGLYFAATTWVIPVLAERFGWN